MSSDSEDDGMSTMWSSYLRSQEEDETKSKEARAEEAYARSRSRAIMTSIKIVRGAGGALSKDSAIELFDLNHKVATTNGSRAINIHNITEEELKRFFVNRCDVFEELGPRGCPGVKLQDVHEAYQLVLKTIRGRKTLDDWNSERENRKKKKTPTIK